MKKEISRLVVLLFLSTLAHPVTANESEFGWWVIEYLNCTQEARTQGLSREDARALCTSPDCLSPSPEIASESAGGPGSWLIEFLTCAQDAHAQGLSEKEASALCGEGAKSASTP